AQVIVVAVLSVGVLLQRSANSTEREEKPVKKKTKTIKLRKDYTCYLMVLSTSHEHCS
uniref:Uncharacterized protein n=1 Tax=Lepisosteus oculatus TaxID=7918 RepID=W5N5C5_LEPOC